MAQTCNRSTWGVEEDCKLRGRGLLGSQFWWLESPNSMALIGAKGDHNRAYRGCMQKEHMCEGGHESEL
jgi:hypothetical protein